MKHPHFAAVCLATIIILANSSCLASKSGSPECVFDAEQFSAATYEGNAKVRHVEWLDESSQALVVTTGGDLIRIRHWSCTHLGLEARMYLDREDLSESALRDKLETLAAISLHPTDSTALMAAVSVAGTLLDQNRLIDVPTATYSEFYAEIEHSETTYTLTIKYYRD